MRFDKCAIRGVLTVIGVPFKYDCQWVSMQNSTELNQILYIHGNIDNYHSECLQNQE